MTREVEVRVQFGSFIIDLTCEREDVADFIKVHFDETSSAAPSDVSLKVSVLSDENIPNIESGKSYVHSVDKHKFNFGPDLIKGSWNDKKRTCRLALSESILSTEEIWLLNRIMCRIFYTLFFKEKGDDKKAFIVHSSAVIKNGKGYVFFGPAGSGKSTVAHFSERCEVLHDDMNLVVMSQKGSLVQGIPFNPTQLRLSDRRGPLSMFFSLHKSDEAKIEKGSRDEFASAVLPEIFLPQPVLSGGRRQAFQYLLNCVNELAEKVPYYRLFFKRDKSFWDPIEALEDVHGGYQQMPH